MKTKVSPALVGMFVLGAIVLALAALFSFGGVNFFSKPQRFIVYFDESIHGLDLGSPVKLRGVRLGRVVDLNIRYNAVQNKSKVAVLCELSRNTLSDDKGNTIDVSDRGELQKLIDRGLRAQLGILGLATGLLYVELGFYDPKEFPAPQSDVVEVRYAVIPPMESTISQFQTNLTEILNDIKGVNFADLGKELRGLVADTRRQISGLDVAVLTQEWTKAARSVNTLATSGEIPRAFENLNGVIADLRGTIGKIDRAVDPAATELTQTLAKAKETLAAFTAAAGTVRNFVSAQDGLGEEAGRALTQLAEAAATVQRLADFLERNPNALLTGKKAPR